MTTKEQFNIINNFLEGTPVYYRSKYNSDEFKWNLVEKEHQTVVNAIDTVYNSATYKALSNPETGLYYQSSGYVLDYLLKELQYGKL